MSESRSDSGRRPAMSDLDDDLRQLAEAHGIATRYQDANRTWRQPSPDTVRAVLAAMGVDLDRPGGLQGALHTARTQPARRLVPHSVVAQHDRADSWRVTLHLPLEGDCGVFLALEDGGRRALGDPGPAGAPIDVGGQHVAPCHLRLPDDLPTGYHTLVVEAGGAGIAGRREQGLVAVAPARCPVPGDLAPGWGWMLQLYALRSSASWGIGDLGDLRDLAAWSAAELGAAFVQVNPLHAATPVTPLEPSPYYPSSRRFSNPVYLRIEDLPELAVADPDTRGRVAALADQLRPANRSDRIDRDAVWDGKREALELLHAASAGPARAEALASYRAEHGEALEDFALFCALAERHGPDWTRWPKALRRPSNPEVEAARAELAGRVDFHVWLQLCCEEQRAAAQRTAGEAGMRIGLIHDLAVGVDPGGADAWRLQAELALGMSVGAPPDPFNQQGQDWGLPPLRPDRLLETGFAPLREVLSAALRHAGGVRIDHVMGLFRLWWVPHSNPPTDGAYVRYPGQDLMALLALEAERSGALVVGEDLGTVEDVVRDTMGSLRVLGSRVVYFERDDGRPRAPERYPVDAVASITTHDLPTVAGWWADEELRVREELGMLGEDTDAEQERSRKAEERAAMLAHLRALRLLGDDPSPRDLIEAMHAFVGRTASLLAAVAPTDAVGDLRQPNLPGTTGEYPNWRLPIADESGPVLLDDLRRDERVLRTVAVVREGRRLAARRDGGGDGGP